MEESWHRQESLLFEKEEVEKAVRIIKSLISQRSVAKAQDAEAESLNCLHEIRSVSSGI